jgi:hypothetical protein
MSTDYPDDSDGDALRRVAAGGSNMSEPMDIDFQIAAPDEATAKRIGDQAARLAYRVSIYFDDLKDEGIEDVDDPWTCECSKHMVPTYDAIIAAQVELDAIARLFGSHMDGWGTFGNVDSSA